MSVVLGLNAFHGDSAACILRDGRLVAAAEEERFRRIKHWAGFPSEAVRYCLNEAGVTIRDVHHIAINQDRRASLLRKATFALINRPSPSFILDRIRNKRRRAGIVEQLKKSGYDGFVGEVHSVEHHIAHLTSAYLVSPFAEASVASIDGFGDFASAAWGIGQQNRITIEDRIYFPHSLGVFYQAITQYLGFPKYGDEYKVMGLAPYGEPRFLKQLSEIVRLRPNGTFEVNLRMFRHHTEHVPYQWEHGEPVVGRLFSSALEELLGPARQTNEALTQRHKDIARSAQALYEDAFFNLLNSLHRRHGLDNVALAGGCAMNSVANGRIQTRTPFKRVYVQSAAGDAGGAIGAAFHLWNKVAVASGANRFAMDHAYWGPQYSDTEIGELLRQRYVEVENANCSVDHGNAATICRRTASAIAEGKVVGWFQGRMEWGPRALGNRSILCDPRRADMKDILNSKIKRRESFRPFAPSILREAVNEWFETDHDVPFMMQVYQFRPEKRSAVPAVVHVDGSGRLQTVTPESNALYYRLIEEFRHITGVPMVLNTSFNENEPVVCRPDEALDCFLRTRMDVLVMGSYLLTRLGA